MMKWSTNYTTSFHEQIEATIISWQPLHVRVHSNRLCTYHRKTSNLDQLTACFEVSFLSSNNICHMIRNFYTDSVNFPMIPLDNSFCLSNNKKRGVWLRRLDPRFWGERRFPGRISRVPWIQRKRESQSFIKQSEAESHFQNGT